MFKNSSGRWLTKALFFEHTLPETREHAVFTLKDENHIVDGVEYVSLKQAFLSCNDPTEYEFATKFLGGWSHWKEMCSTQIIAPHIEQWREERDVRLKSIGQRKLIEMASAEDASFQAAKWLADKGWEEKATKGRPTKSDIKRAASEHASRSSHVKSDWERLRDG